MAKKPSEIVTARVLADSFIGRTLYRCGDVVRLPGAVADQYSGLGVLDSHPDAVAYATSSGADVREHEG